VANQKLSGNDRDCGGQKNYPPDVDFGASETTIHV
jgi:hypothetical protein